MKAVYLENARFSVISRTRKHKTRKHKTHPNARDNTGMLYEN